MNFQFKFISKIGNTMKCFSLVSFPFMGTFLLRKYDHFKYMSLVNRNKQKIQATDLHPYSLNYLIT